MGDVGHFASKWDSVAPKIAYRLTLNINIAFVSLKKKLYRALSSEEKGSLSVTF